MITERLFFFRYNYVQTIQNLVNLESSSIFEKTQTKAIRSDISMLLYVQNGRKKTLITLKSSERLLARKETQKMRLNDPMRILITR